MCPFVITLETHLKGHVLRLNDEITRRVRSLKVTRRIHPAGGGAHLAAPSGRASADRVVETSGSRGTHPDGADGARLAASPAAEVHGSHAAVGGALGAVAVSPWLTERLQPQLQIRQTRLPRLTTAAAAAFHLQIGDPSVEIADVALRCDSANTPYASYADRYAWHALGVQSTLQTVPRCRRWRLLLLLRLHSANLTRKISRCKFAREFELKICNKIILQENIRKMMNTAI